MTCVCAVAAALAGCSKRSGDDATASSANLNTAPAPAPTPGAGIGLVISQVYGGAGEEGAVFSRDYVELFNRSNAPVSLAGLSLHWASAAGDFVPYADLPGEVTIPPGGYYLLGFAGGLWGQDLRVDFAGGKTIVTSAYPSTWLNVTPANGKVALARTVDVDRATASDASAALLSQLLNCGSADAGSCVSTNAPNSRVVDLLGYGFATDHQGSAPAPAPNLAKAIIRKNGGCAASGNNADDFEVGAPTPHSSLSPTHVCGGS